MSRSIIATWQNFSPQLLSILRITTGVMFMMAGTMKLFAWPIGMPPNNGPAELMTQVGFGGLLEFVGGLLFLFGLCTRPVAFVLAGEMAVAYFQFHAPQSVWPIVNGGQTAVLYCFIFLYFSAKGAGPWSIDALRSHKAPESPRGIV